MTHQEKGMTFHAADFPVLRDILPGYLHQDFVQDYGSAEGALQAFLSEASGDEILGVKEEWQRFRKTMSERPLEEIQAALVRLGVAWRPEKEEELKGVDEILSRAEA
jgi:hypothetical protein